MKNIIYVIIVAMLLSCRATKVMDVVDGKIDTTSVVKTKDVESNFRDITKILSDGSVRVDSVVLTETYFVHDTILLPSRTLKAYNLQADTKVSVEAENVGVEVLHETVDSTDVAKGWRFEHEEKRKLTFSHYFAVFLLGCVAVALLWLWQRNR